MNDERSPRHAPGIRQPQPDDAELSALLRGLGGPPPEREADWEALRGAIRERATLPLARRRAAPPPPSVPAWRRRRVLAPLAAAGLALAVWAGAGPGENTAPVAGAFPTAEEVLAADISEEEFRELVSGRAHADELLLIALD